MCVTLFSCKRKGGMEEGREEDTELKGGKG